MESEPTIAGFDRLALSPAVLKAVRELGYEVPTPVQAQSIPHLLEGSDLLGQAQTGTGKTAAFALPLLSRIEPERVEPQLLVLAPTRELALQVSEAFQSYARHMKGFHVLPLYGGQNMSVQLRQLKRGVHVIVGTPGRVMDHLRRGTLSLDGLSCLVLDEADEMLKMGFVEDIEWIFEQAPQQRQVALFSATMPDAIRRVARRHLTKPVEIKVAARTATVSTIDQRHCVVTGHHKMDALTRVLEVEPFDAMIVFVRTRNATVEVADKLEAHGFAAEALNGDMNQAMRERVVDRLKKGSLDIVVATDVAARGLDVERITHVVNYDIPNDPEAYVHRIGRTGRAGREGHALLFVQPRERHLLRAIERSTRHPIPPMEMPSADDLSEHRIERFVAQIRETLAEQDLDFYYRLVDRIENEQELSSLDIAAALTFMSQGERPFVVEELKKHRPEKRERHEHAKHKEKGARKGKERHKDDGVQRDRYRIEVGRKHGASPREIVGAIANEAGMDGQYIGYIGIYDDYSTVDLPEGMPRDIFKHLKKVYVCGRPLRIRVFNEDASGKSKSRQLKGDKNKTRKNKKGHSTGKPSDKPLSKKRKSKKKKD